MRSTLAFALLPAAISAVSFDCQNVVVDDQHFNLESLGGPKEVNWQRKTPPSITNTTYTIDFCKPLKKSKDSSAKEQCQSGTRICATQRIFENDQSIVQEVIPIAGEFATSNGRHMDPKFTRLKDSSSHSDSEQEGVRAELHGGLWNKQKQKAIIEFICDAEWEGTEGFDDKSKAMKIDSYDSMGRREEPEEGGDEDDTPLPELDEGKALQFVSYKEEKGDMGVLRLTWKTKYACEGASSKKPSGSASKGWGFFTWFLIIVFLLAATYIIFGSWLNYNRYGARGWDLIPHGDTIRDIPHIMKDWSSSMMDKMKGGGTRGGYSAV
ncbi:related to autophagy Atg27 [Lecanosticta acicola]|uniref:Autophagy-related protein 27 n=1 Tax=Lecanosticta acicola TaxID=111012 RepID=A0AAI9E871_9PEZI|nr:related to autophagy Atg27 [Lecanosticta acicola]